MSSSSYHVGSSLENRVVIICLNDSFSFPNLNAVTIVCSCLCSFDWLYCSFSEFANFSPSLQFKYMDIELHLDDEILELIGPSESMDGPEFSIKAAKIGITSLYVSW